MARYALGARFLNTASIDVRTRMRACEAVNLDW